MPDTPRPRAFNRKIALADRGARALPRARRDARQERADGRAELERRGLEPVGLLPGEDHPPDRRAHRGRGGRAQRGRSRPTPPSSEAVAKRLDAWSKTVARWESEPETQEGRRELAARAKKAEEKRDLALARYHHYEVSSAAFQIAIVLASATVITGAIALAWLAIGVGGDRARLRRHRALRAARRASLLAGAHSGTRPCAGSSASLGILAVAWLLFLASPFVALHNFAREVEARDVEAIRERINFRVAAALAPEAGHGGRGAGARPARSIPASGSSPSASPRKLADPVVAQLLTPEAIVDLLNGAWPGALQGSRPGATRTRRRPPSCKEMRIRSFNGAWRLFRRLGAARLPQHHRHAAAGPSAGRQLRLRLRLVRGTWKLVQIELPATHPAGARAPAPGAGSHVKRGGRAAPPVPADLADAGRRAYAVRSITVTILRVPGSMITIRLPTTMYL